MTFGQRLYELRKEKNISQEELAELLDVSRQSISKWENDKAYPEMTRLLFMSDNFQVSLDYLMRGVETVVILLLLSLIKPRICWMSGTTLCGICRRGSANGWCCSMF